MRAGSAPEARHRCGTRRQRHVNIRTMNRLLSVVCSRTDKIIESGPRGTAVVRGYGESNHYVVPAMVICAGWAETNLDDHTVKWFGVSLPKVFPTAESWRDFAADAHMWLAYSMLIIAGGHVLLALKHRYPNGHDVIHRMTFGRQR